MKSGWYTTGHLTPLAQYTHGDLNFDGITNLRDMYILHEALLAAGSGSAALGEFAGNVPEPSSLVFVLTTFAAFLMRQRSLRRPLAFGRTCDYDTCTNIHISHGFALKFDRIY
jgi:hypothetical protein